MPKLITAVALSDVVSHGLKAGQLVEGSEALIKALAKDGSVDTDKAAIAYARSQEAPVVRSAIELAAEKRAEQRTALLAEIAKAEAAMKDAKDEETRAAVEADLAAKQELLAALDA